MKTLIPVIVAIVLGFLFHHLNLVNTTKFNVYAKSVKYWVSKEWGNLSKTPKCGIKTTRKQPGGIAQCGGYLLKPVNFDMYGQVMLFYRYGTIYRNYLINYKAIQPCEFVRKHRTPKYSNPLADLVVAGIKDCCPQFNHECPYMPGWYNVSADINATIAPLLPPVIPAGTFKVYGRAYLVGNITIGEGEGVGVVKANHENRATDFSMLNMG